jgi:hypothetical protein
VRILLEASASSHHHRVTTVCRIVFCLVVIGIIEKHIVSTLIVSILLSLIELPLLVVTGHIPIVSESHQAVIVYIGYFKIQKEYREVENPC